MASSRCRVFGSRLACSVFAFLLCRLESVPIYSDWSPMPRTHFSTHSILTRKFRRWTFTIWRTKISRDSLLSLGCDVWYAPLTMHKLLHQKHTIYLPRCLKNTRGHTHAVFHIHVNVHTQNRSLYVHGSIYTTGILYQRVFIYIYIYIYICRYTYTYIYI